MTEETEKVDEPASEVQKEENAATEEQAQEKTEEQAQEEKMVPLSALQAERKKRQQYEAYLAQQQNQQQEPEDDDEWLSRGDFKQEKTMTKREILEEVYCDSHPERVQEINKHLEEIIQRKPWLGDSIATATNRYARAWEIVQDYKGLYAEKQQKSADAKKIVENSKKPGSPAAIGKSGATTQADFLLSMRGKKEFREYRKELLGRR
jgi:small-conductance mechanosensitive channel